MYIIKDIRSNLAFAGFYDRWGAPAIMWNGYGAPKRYRRLQAAYNAAVHLRDLSCTVAVYDESGQEVDLTRLEQAENLQMQRAGHTFTDMREAGRLCARE